MKTRIIAEAGINHSGDLQIAKELILVAKLAKCDYVKFQKRTPSLCIPEHQKNVMKDTPWGIMNYLKYKERLEFGKCEYDKINEYCKEVGIQWFASVWDIPSVDFMLQYTNIGKIPSALITNDELLIYSRRKFSMLMISTGMSTEEEIERAVEIGNPDIIFHTNSCYPAKVSELNLNYIKHLKKKFSSKIIGYSGHEFGLTPSLVAVVLGAEYIERHFTIDRTMWGSDQLASVEPHGLYSLVESIRDVEKSLGVGGNRKLLKSEMEKREMLRK